MSGPATKMHEALRTIAEEDEGRAGNVAARAGMDITYAQLEAMDAAVPAHEAAMKNLRECVVVVARTGLNDLSETEQELLLGTLLERAIQRRKEAGRGA